MSARWRLLILVAAAFVSCRFLDRFSALPDMATSAFEDGDLAKAREYATELLDMAKERRSTGKSGYSGVLDEE